MSILNRHNNQSTFPETGTSTNRILERIFEFKKNLPSRTHGQFGLYAMEGKNSVQELGEQAYLTFIRLNTVFSSVLPGLAMIEDELQAMCVEIHNGGPLARANITSGGTESIYCALHAIREWAKVEKPEISSPEVIVPYSAHIAFSRGAHYLGIKLIRVATGPDYRADLSAIEEAISPSTVAVAASAPCWPYDLFDPISEIAQLTCSHGLWFHVDACLGGFLAPFLKEAGYSIPQYDFNVPGVSSISADLHKYGYSPKPCSTILWRSEVEQQYHYCAKSDWPSGPYLSQGILGSGPAGATVAAWAVLSHLGLEGYVEIAKNIMATKEKLADAIGHIEYLSVWKTDTASLMISSDLPEIQEITRGMNKKGWVLWGNNDPPLIHLTVDWTKDEVIETFITDLECVTQDVSSTTSSNGLASGIYGTGIPDETTQLPKWNYDAWNLINSKRK